jgi:hypothetical protein
MGRKRAVEEDAAERRRPILVDVLEREIHDLERDEAQAVIDEVGRHVCQHDKARGQPEFLYVSDCLLKRAVSS